MADKLRTMQNLEAMQARYVGTGHADTTKYDWVSNIVRDSYASYIGHPPLLSYMSVGMGEPKEKVRAQMIEKMVRGAGNPPEVGFFDSRLRLNGTNIYIDAGINVWMAFASLSLRVPIAPCEDDSATVEYQPIALIAN